MPTAATTDFRCPQCYRRFRVSFRFNRHLLKCKGRARVDPLPDMQPQQLDQITCEVYESALKGCCKSVRFKHSSETGPMLPHEFFRAAKPMIHSQVNNLEEHADEYKVQPILRLTVVKVDAEGNVISRHLLYVRLQ